MTSKEYFDRATLAEIWSGWIFIGVLALSLTALIVPQAGVQDIVNPLLIAICIIGVAVSAIGSFCQNEGNQLLRATQLTNAFDVPIGTTARSDYYNNLFPPSVDRLAATTFENSLFTSTVLNVMLKKVRLKIAGYIFVFILLMAFRWSSTNTLLLFAQTVFSVDVVWHWLRMERFLMRACRVKRELHQLFMHGGIAGDKKGFAIALAAFSNYECAKDEAAMPLDGKIFEKINIQATKEWDELRARLNIP